MNQQERDELRAKHRRNGVLGCWTCQDYSWNDDYPCDVIKVLDALEESKKNLQYLSQALRTISWLTFSDVMTGETGEDAMERIAREALGQYLVSPAQTETTEYPPKGQFEFVDPECNHIKGNPYCPKCGEKL